jgi:murein DD-endopeptidase MepM/ murein hydrolase activator NlpD
MKTKTYILWAIIVAILLFAGFLVVRKVQAPVGKSRSDIISNESAPVLTEPGAGLVETPATNGLPPKINITQTVDPLDGALSRITKKPFGIFIIPKTSPVQPERFSGYHTAVDLETTPAEQNIDVPVKALCDGKLLVAKKVGGYGGVAVESCVLEGQAVTVIYGHIKLASVTTKVGDQLKAGDFLANLGTGFSQETDGERKHLHLGIHKGTSINILGYVQNKNQLNGWIDPAKYLN